MLVIDISVADFQGKRQIVTLEATRDAPHPKLPNTYFYRYRAYMDKDWYAGTVLHNYNNGPIALTAKVAKAVLAMQKVARKAQAK